MFFFFFDGNNYGVTNSLIGAINETEVVLDDVKDALQRESEKKGLRNVDLTLLNDWTPSKTSKIMAGKQKLTADDIRVWSRSLGCTPDPFIDKGMNFRQYNVSSYVRNVSDCLESYFDSWDSDEASDAIVRYELPLAIISLLGIDASDYVFRTQKSSYGIMPGSKSSFGNLPTCIRFWHKSLDDGKRIYPQMSFLLSPENEYFIFSINISNVDDEKKTEEERNRFKDILQVEEATTEEFHQFSSRQKDWIPQLINKGEVFSFGDDTNMLPGPGDIQRCFIDIFIKYCDLVWEVFHIDIMPEKLKDREPLSPIETFRMLNNSDSFEWDVAEAVKKRENYLCENDSSHKSFSDVDGHPYMEVVPIVPFLNGAQYGKAIKSSANAVCLCPMCAAQIKHGCKEDREDMLIKLFRKHKDQLAEKGIEKSLTSVLADNGLA